MIFSIFSQPFAALIYYFHFDLTRTTSIGEMVVFLLDSFVYTFMKTISGVYFSFIPIIFLFINTFRPYIFQKIKKFLLRLAKIISISSYLCVLLPTIGIGKFDAIMSENVVGSLFVVDFVQLLIWAWVITIIELVDAQYFLLGPAFVVSELCDKMSDLKFNIPAFLLVMLTAVPSLYWGHYRTLQIYGEKVLRIEIDFIEWHPFQLFAFLQIFISFFSICTLVPVFRNAWSLIHFMILTLVTNANVAAGAALLL